MAHTFKVALLFLAFQVCGSWVFAQGNDADFKSLPEEAPAGSGETAAPPLIPNAGSINNAGAASEAPAAKLNYAPDPTRGFVKGRVVNNGALVYKLPDFDSPVLGKLALGKVFLIYPKVLRAFYKIQVGQKFGYIADSDIRILAVKDAPVASSSAASKKVARPAEKTKEATIKKKKILSQERTLGAEVMSLNYAENVLGGHHAQSRTGFGFKLSGPDIALGAADTEINLVYLPGAPSYYSTSTTSADGFIFITDLQVMSVKDLNRFMASYFGLGPMLRFSHYLIANTVPHTVVASTVVDSLNLGLVASLGLGIRLGAVILRPEFRLQWERQTYWGSGVSLSTEF